MGFANNGNTVAGAAHNGSVIAGAAYNGQVVLRNLIKVSISVNVTRLNPSDASPESGYGFFISSSSPNYRGGVLKAGKSESLGTGDGRTFFVLEFDNDNPYPAKWFERVTILNPSGLSTTLVEGVDIENIGEFDQLEGWARYGDQSSSPPYIFDRAGTYVISLYYKG